VVEVEKGCRGGGCGGGGVCGGGVMEEEREVNLRVRVFLEFHIS